MALEADGSSGSVSTGSNAVIGFQSDAFSSGADVVLLDGTRSDYSVQVTAAGTTTIINTSTKQSITVTGETYIVFDGNELSAGTAGGAYTTNGSAYIYSQAYFIETGTNAEIAEIYNAALGREPDLAGLEYWINHYKSDVSSGMTSAQALTEVSQGFLTSNEFTKLMGGTGAGDTANATYIASLSDTAFLTELYQNILDRAPDASGLQYWLNDLAGGDSRANVLVGFATSVENIARVSAVAGSSVSSDTGWLINPTGTGGFADIGQKIDATTVLTEAASTGYVNTGLIDTSTMHGDTGIGNYDIFATSATAVPTKFGATVNGETIVASSTLSIIYVYGNYDTLISAANGGSTLFPTGLSDSISLHGTGNTVGTLTVTGPASAANTQITGYVVGADKILLDATGDGAPILVTPTSSNPYNGSVWSSYKTAPLGGIVIDVGDVGDGSAASVAAAANKVYTVSDTSYLFPNQTTTSAAQAEHAIFIGQSGNNTVVYYWGVASTSSQTLADVNLNHQVDAAELTAGVTLVGITATNLTASDFHY